jgi:hypothetical protein
LSDQPEVPVERFAPKPRKRHESARALEKEMDRHPAIRDELNRILENLERIVSRGETAFLDPDDEILYLAGSQLIVNFDDLAQKRLPASLKQSHPEIPWKRITRTRNILAHEYLAADREIAWVAVSKELPELVRLLLET